MLGIHRGGAPENTLAGFWEAVAAGAYMLELDVRVTRDGALVLMHDVDVARTTEGYGPLGGYTLRELWALGPRGARVPTLTQFLWAFAPLAHLHFLFDLKEEAAARATLCLLAHYPELEGRYVLGATLEGTSALLVQERAAGVLVMASVTRAIQLILAHSTGLGHLVETREHELLGFELLAETRFLWSERLVASLHDAGLRVLVCGPDLVDPTRVREALAWGVDIVLCEGAQTIRDVYSSSSQQHAESHTDEEA